MAVKYLGFQVFTAGPGFTTTPGTNLITKMPPAGFLEGEAVKIIAAIGSLGIGDRKLAMIVGPLCLDHTHLQIKDIIAQSFDIARRHKIAVGFHVDDSKFWRRRADLLANPVNLEARDWSGTPSTGQYLHWGGEPWKLAPQVNFASPIMLNAAKIVADIIGARIALHLNVLRRAGELDLFAGVIAGWETAIGVDYDTMGELGYRALGILGYGPDSLPANISAARRQIVQTWIGQWTKSLKTSGVPADKIYSHIALTTHTPIDVAFGPNHNPGFSVYPGSTAIVEIYGATHNQPWASAECANVDIHHFPWRLGAGDMASFLGDRFDHGATLVNIFGFGIGNPASLFRLATEDDAAIAAYRNFLA